MQRSEQQYGRSRQGEEESLQLSHTAGRLSLQVFRNAAVVHIFGRKSAGCQRVYA
jgi:hypothetical protein